MRFSEMDAIMPNQLDFVPRERQRQIWYVVFAFVTTMLLVLVTGYANIFSRIEIVGPMIAVLLIAILCLYILYRKQKNLDLVMSTEYQNMLFSQALSLGCSFCMIVRHDGTIVYTSDGFANVFPDFNYSEAMALQGVFERGAVRASDRERIMGSIRSATPDHLIFPLMDKYSAKKEYIITVDPLQRPSGFAIIRGREYLGQRAGTQLMPDILRSTTVDKLDHMLATTEVGHYTTNGYGQFEYVNPAFERMCGYAPGEILEQRLSLHHVIFTMDGNVLTEEYSIHAFNGTATLQQRSGSRINLPLSQHIMRDSAGKAVSATGTLTPVFA